MGRTSHKVTHVTLSELSEGDRFIFITSDGSVFDGIVIKHESVGDGFAYDFETLVSPNGSEGRTYAMDSRMSVAAVPMENSGWSRMFEAPTTGSGAVTVLPSR